MLFSSLFKYTLDLLPTHFYNEQFYKLDIDSRNIASNDVFIAQEGYSIDSHNFIPELLEIGAWIICENSYILPTTHQQFKDKIIYVPSTGNILALLSKAYFESPDESMTIIGITGTNGKTTITTFLYQILNQLGYKCGLIGTIKNIIGTQIKDSKNTTPNGFELYQLLYEMKKNQCTHVIMEVSSHALSLGRLGHIAIDIGAITNITPDHLDFHHNMEEYFQAKLKILDLLEGSSKQNKIIIINKGILNNELILKKSQEKFIPYTFFRLIDSETKITKDIDISSEIINMDIKGTYFVINNKIDNPIKTSLIGAFNIENLLVIISILTHLGISIEYYKPFLTTLSVDGRFEDVTSNLPFTVIIDYAHSPDALENILKTAKKLTPNKLITIFGCGGNRDTTKRPKMGYIAAQYSDTVIITSDNPRKENPLQILDDIRNGISKEKQNKLNIIPNRKTAIEYGFSLLKTGDIMIIAGKGHETYQIFKNKTIYFSDHQIIKKISQKQVQYESN